jgi:hypothetical protein
MPSLVATNNSLYAFPEVYLGMLHRQSYFSSLDIVYESIQPLQMISSTRRTYMR